MIEWCWTFQVQGFAPTNYVYVVSLEHQILFNSGDSILELMNIGTVPRVIIEVIQQRWLLWIQLKLALIWNTKLVNEFAAKKGTAYQARRRGACIPGSGVPPNTTLLCPSFSLNGLPSSSKRPATRHD